MKSLFLLVVSLSVLFAIFSITVDSATFKCSSTDKCQSLIGYNVTNATTISAINNLFGVKSLNSLLAENSLPLSTNLSHTFPVGSTVKVPIPCKCGNGTGISDGTPIYTVKKGDGLDYIARNIFEAFVTYQEIQTVNGIEDADVIKIGQVLKIPLPCSCDDVDGATVVHYAHLVAAGSSVEQIAEEFGTTEQTLLSLNNLKSPKDLLAGAVLDVPLKVGVSPAPQPAPQTGNNSSPQTGNNSSDGGLRLKESRWTWILLSLNVGLFYFGLNW